MYVMFLIFSLFAAHPTGLIQLSCQLGIVEYEIRCIYTQYPFADFLDFVTPAKHIGKTIMIAIHNSTIIPSSPFALS